MVKHTDFYDKNKKFFSNELLDIIEFPDNIDIKTVLYELFINFILLPVADNQKDFNFQMQ
jgi:hypothetical protein